MSRPLVALGVALVVATCDAAPAASPQGSAAGTPAVPGTASPAPTVGANGTSPACGQVPPSAEGPAWRDRVFYEVFVRSFADGDGDGIGDLTGLTERLDYLNDGDPASNDDLGITGIWLMPVAESPSYHGYDVTDYAAVERDYGDPAAMRAFLEAAHARGILVIVDLVLNHTSREHPWFQDAVAGGERRDWYLWADERPPVARSDGTRVWHEAGDDFYYGYFWEGMPDLNLANPDVTAALDEVARFWLDEVGVDGFRLDAAKHLFEDGDQLENVPATFEWLAGFRERVHATHPDALILGEVFDATSVSSKYVREGSLDLTFDFGLASATLTSLKSRSSGLLKAALPEVAGAYPPDTLATFLTNHDQNRVASQLTGDPAVLRLAATLLLTAPGTPFLYYGEEIGMSGVKPDERIRTPMRWEPSAPAFGFTTATPWQPVSNDPAGTDVATQLDDPASLLATYRSLIRTRSTHPGLGRGGIVPVEAADRNVVAFLRSEGDSHALVVANVGIQPVPAPALTLADGPLCGAPVAVSLVGPEAAAPTISASGGFAGYVPVDVLGPQEAVVIDLTAR